MRNDYNSDNNLKKKKNGGQYFSSEIAAPSDKYDFVLFFFFWAGGEGGHKGFLIKNPFPFFPSLPFLPNSPPCYACCGQPFFFIKRSKFVRLTWNYSTTNYLSSYTYLNNTLIFTTTFVLYINKFFLFTI